MKLNATDLAKLLGVLEKIDRGRIQPRMPGRMGRFLRQYERGRAELNWLLKEHGVERRADSAISGRALGGIEIHPLVQPEVSLLDLPLGEVAGAMAISDELGGIANVTMWLKGRVANTAYNLLRQNPGLRLTGDYRWNPPGRLTLGEAQLEVSQTEMSWRHARCLKAVADDLTRPPHALEYLLDYRLGPPGLKYFRCVCAVRREQQWQVLPGLTHSRPLEVTAVVPETSLDAHELWALLMYCEPWSRSWTIAGAAPIEADDALAHAITWADFQRELGGAEIDAATATGLRESLRASGVIPADSGRPNLTRSLLPVAREILRWLRGSA